MRLTRFALAALLLCSTRIPAQPEAPENPALIVQTDAGHGDSINGLQLSPDGKSVALFGENWRINTPGRPRSGTLQTWDVASRQKTLELVGHETNVSRAFWSPDGKRLVSQSRDGQIALWKVASGKMLSALSPAGKYSFSSYKTAQEAARSSQAEQEKPELLGFSRDGSQVLALGSVNPERPATLPNGKLDWQAFADATQPLLRSWDAADGHEMKPLTFGKKGARLNNRIALRPDGKSFVIANPNIRNGVEGTAEIETRDLQTGALLASFPITGRFSYLTCLSDDGSRALSVDWQGDKFDKSRAQVWNVALGKPLQVLEDAEVDMVHARFSRGNSQILADAPGGTIIILDAASGQKMKRLGGGHCSDSVSSQITPGGKYLLSMGSGESRVQRWDLAAPPSQSIFPRVLAESYNLRSISFAPDGTLWFGSGAYEGNDSKRIGTAILFRKLSAQGKPLELISIPEPNLVEKVVFSPDFSLAAASLSSNPRPGELSSAGIGVWDIKARKLLWRVGSDDSMDCMAFSPEGKYLVASKDGSKVQRWDALTGAQGRELLSAPSRVLSLAFSPDGATLAAGTAGGSIILLSMPGGQKISEWSDEPSISALAFSGDGRFLAAGGTLEVAGKVVGSRAGVWELKSGELLRAFDLPRRTFGGLVFSGEGSRLALCHYSEGARREDGRIEVWDVAEDRLDLTLRDCCGAQAPAFAPDDRSLVSIDGHWIKSWDLSRAR